MEDSEDDSIADFRVTISDRSSAEDDVADVGLAAGSVAGSTPAVVARIHAQYSSQSSLAGTIGCYEHAVRDG